MNQLKCLRIHTKQWILVLYLVLTISSCHTDGLSSSSNERGERKLFGGYRITPKFCKPSKTLPKTDPRSHGPTICMFNHECSQRQGEVVGACMDGFLFGACCQLSGSTNTSFVEDYNKPSSNMYGTPPIIFNGAHNHVTVSNGYGGSDSILIEASPKPATSTTEKSGIYLSSSPGAGQVFSPELPTHMTGSYESTPTTVHQSSTANKNKVSYTKPHFRPKPTESKISTDKYVLVHTISNDKNEVSPKPQGISDNEIESIESIILMLNDTKTGPQYSTDTRPPFGYDATNTYISSLGNTNNYYITTKLPSSSSRPTHYATTAVVSSTKRPALQTVTISSTYGTVSSTAHTPTAIPITSSSVYVKGPTLSYTGVSVPSTTKSPLPSYVYSTTRPKRPATPSGQNKITSTTSKKPTKSGQKKPSGQKVTSRPGSTSYVHGPTPARPSSPTKTPVIISSYSTITSRPQTSTTAPIINKLPPSTPAPTVIVLGPYGSASEIPAPTIHITPKPTVNIISSSTMWTNNPEGIKITPPPLPQTSYVYGPIITKKPLYSEKPVVFTSLAALGTTPGYESKPINNDFDDPGYYGISSTSRPVVANFQTVTSSSIYTVVDDNLIGSSSPIYGPSTVNDEIYTSPNDLNNFPPVRNPNLNASLHNGLSTVEDYDISTPQFVEDELLNDKMSLLVSKIVESLQDSFHNLADVVVENKTDNTQRPSTVKRPQSTKKPPQRATTKRPPLTRPATTKPPRPSSISLRPSSSSKPNRRTTKRPNTTVFINTTKRPATKVSTSKRPLTKTTRKPTTTIQYGQTEDLIVEEEEEEEEDVGEETGDSVAEESTAFFENGKIQCGVRPHVKSARIVGGKGATFGEWPWQVLVRESTWLGLFTKNKCGGVLITKNFVMTAAHCQPGFLASLVAVFGEFDISGDLEPKRSVTKNVKRIVVHREYDAATFENDLALLELESPIHYDTHIVPICMPPDVADFTGRMATVTGWGRLKYGGGVPSVLQEVQVPIIENSVCQEMFHTAGHNKKILPSFLCAGYANGQKDSCEGDSGGPLVLQRPDGRWELVGTVSHGIKCAAPYLPGVYMRTTYYKPWLQSVTGV